MSAGAVGFDSFAKKHEKVLRPVIEQSILFKFARKVRVEGRLNNGKAVQITVNGRYFFTVYMPSEDVMEPRYGNILIELYQLLIARKRVSSKEMISIEEQLRRQIDRQVTLYYCLFVMPVSILRVILFKSIIWLGYFAKRLLDLDLVDLRSKLALQAGGIFVGKNKKDRDRDNNFTTMTSFIILPTIF